MNNRTLYIAGQWDFSDSILPSISPNDGSVVGEFSVASSSHVDQAVQAAKEASTTWRTVDIAHRAEILKRFADLLVLAYGDEGEETDLKQLIHKESGKRIQEADIEVAESADMARYFADIAPITLRDRELRLDESLWPSKKSVVVREPWGVVAVIKPWNYPLELPLWAISAALVAGNAVIFKPSEYSPFVGMRIVEMLLEAGLPQNVIQLLTGDDTTGRLLVQHEGIDYVSFTGSALTGSKIASQLAPRFIPQTLELGGIDAAIVCEDADIALAVNGLVWGSFTNGGQVCVRPKRIFVHENVYEEFLARAVAITNELRLGIDVGPLISSSAVDQVEQFIDDALTKGARCHTGGQRADLDGGFYLEPTVLTDIPYSAALADEECFGPVMCIWPVKNVSEAVLLSNSVKQGLGGSVWTCNPEAARYIMNNMRVGMCWHNDVNVAFPQAPWGGRKQSGVGVELGEEGLLEFAPPKHLSFDSSEAQHRDWWFPY